MSWLSSIGNAIGNVAKGAVKAVGSVAKSVLPGVASFAVGLIPGVGPILSKGVDALGNALVGSSADPTTDSGPSSTPVMDMLAQASANLTQLQATNTAALGNSPAAQALAASSTASNFLGIGGSDPGVLGIGDKKPGVLGIGTGKAKAKKAAEAAATAAGKSATEVKAAGEAAAAKVNDDGTPTSSINPLYILGGALLALLAL